MLTATLLLVSLYIKHKNKPENIPSYSFSDLWFCKILFSSLCLSLRLSLSQDPDFIIKVGNSYFEFIREILSATQRNSMATNGNLRPNVIRRLAKELKTLDESPPEGIKVIVDDEDLTTIFAEIDGPAGTPYESGVFRMMLCLSNDFPNSPPKGYFQTKIFHPNISTSGEICVNTLKKDWNPTLGLRHVLVVIRCLLIEPFPESALNEQAGKMLLENYEEYAKLARLYTGIHALKPKNRAPTICESTAALNVNRTVKPSLLPSSTKTSANGGVKDDDENTVPRPNQMTGGSKKVIIKKKKKKKVGGGGLEEAANVEKKKIDARKKSLRRL